MISQETGEIRAKVDALRRAVMSEDALQQCIKADLVGFLASNGLLEKDRNTPSLTEPEVRHRSGSVHMCPYNTCGNTRHS